MYVMLCELWLICMLPSLRSRAAASDLHSHLPGLACRRLHPNGAGKCLDAAQHRIAPQTNSAALNITPLYG
jgi:hypothetical protein